MSTDKLESKIKQAFENATPDLLDAILQKSEQQKGKVVYMEQKKRRYTSIKKLTAIAAALVLCIGGAVGYTAYANLAVDSVIALDVNPSIEVEVNSKERVIAVTPLNNDGKTVVGDMDFKGSDVDVAVNALIGSMLRNGYINDISNSILVSVNSDDPQKGAALQSRLAEEINGLLQTDSFKGAVLSQNITPDEELNTLANQYGITAGKAKLVQQITAQNAMHTFEELAPLSINELNLLSGGGSIENVSSVGAASDKAYIGEAAAKAAALAHAGIAESDITRYEAEMDFERGTMVYEIEFHCSGREYDYDVDAKTGEVLWSGSERDDDYTPHKNQNSGESSQQNTSDGNKPEVTPYHSDKPKAESKAENSSYIGDSAAKAAALAHAGLSESQVSRLKCELDREDGRTVYEVEFKSGGYEYDYEIDAESGTVLKYDKERDD